MVPVNNQPVESGIEYVCQRCGYGCRWPGEVRVTAEEIGFIAHFLKIDRDEFIQKRTRLRANRRGLALRDKL